MRKNKEEATREKASPQDIEKELILISSFFEKIWEIQIAKPTLYVGDVHESKFIEISSLKDLARAAMVQAVYDDTINGIYVPEALMWNDSWVDGGYNAPSHRIFSLCHEYGHAVISGLNEKLTCRQIQKLFDNRRKVDREQAYIYRVFHEGMAHFLAIQVCQLSGIGGLETKAEREIRLLEDAFSEWTSSKNLELMAKVYNKDAYDWQAVLLRYFQGNECGFDAYKYILGYHFVAQVMSSHENIKTFIQHPPHKTRHLLYPESYLKTISRK